MATTNTNHIKKIADEVYVKEKYYLTHDGINQCYIDIYNRYFW